jgi:hypothetical protein
VRLIWDALTRDGGNPNHVDSGPKGGQFTSGHGGGGKHAARNRRRRLRKKKRLNELREKGHKAIAEQKAQHAKDRESVIKDQKGERLEQRKTHKEERKTFAKEARADRKAIRDRHATREQDVIDAKLAEDRVTMLGVNKDLRDDVRNAKGWLRDAKKTGDAAKIKDAQDDLDTTLKTQKEYPLEVAEINKGELKEVLKTLRGKFRDDIADHREQVGADHAELLRQQRIEVREKWREHREDRKFFQGEVRREQRELLGSLKRELKSEFPTRKSEKQSVEQAARSLANRINEELDGMGVGT